MHREDRRAVRRDMRRALAKFRSARALVVRLRGKAEELAAAIDEAEQEAGRELGACLALEREHGRALFSGMNLDYHGDHPSGFNTLTADRVEVRRSRPEKGDIGAWLRCDSDAVPRHVRDCVMADARTSRRGTSTINLDGALWRWRRIEPEKIPE